MGPFLLGSGSYTISIINYSCASASRALESFLGAGELPDGWTVDPATKTFRSGVRQFSLSSDRLAATGPDAAPRCPLFTVTDREPAGSVELPRGNYALEPSGDSFDCLDAARLLARIVDGPPGDLPGSWTASATDAAEPGALLEDPDGRQLRLRWVDGETAGGGHTSPEPGRRS